MKIPFTKINVCGGEIARVEEAVRLGHLHGDGAMTARCHELIKAQTGCPLPLLTTSCTSALDMAAMLCGIGEGDEVIVPSFTFVSTANAFALRGARIAWCDVREDTLNIDESKIESLITERTKAVVPVHYAGVACEMDAIMEIAARRGIRVVEDAAQGVGAYYRGRALGAIGDFGALSFHGTKNVTCGEGGAILVNRADDFLRAQIVREKGTNRTEFVNGKVDKYTWVDYGSSFLPSEITAAYLSVQLENCAGITRGRLASWNFYFERLKPLADAGKFSLASVPEGCAHNAHIFYLLANTPRDAKKIFARMKAAGVGASAHYGPLHISPMGRRLAAGVGRLPVSESAAERIVRLPIYSGITEEEQLYVCSVLADAL